MPHPRRWDTNAIIRLRYWRIVQRKTHAEIGALTGLTPNTVRVHLTRHGIVLYPNKRSRQYYHQPPRKLVHVRLAQTTIQAVHQIAAANRISFTEQVQQLLDRALTQSNSTPLTRKR